MALQRQSNTIAAGPRKRDSTIFSAFCEVRLEAWHFKKRKFSRRALLSEKKLTSESHMVNLPDRPKPETVMQFCVGLGLSLEESENLFNAAGYYLGGVGFMRHTERLLSMNDSLTIYECNDVCVIWSCLYWQDG